MERHDETQAAAGGAASSLDDRLAGAAALFGDAPAAAFMSSVRGLYWRALARAAAQANVVLAQPVLGTDGRRSPDMMALNYTRAVGQLSLALRRISAPEVAENPADAMAPAFLPEIDAVLEYAATPLPRRPLLDEAGDFEEPPPDRNDAEAPPSGWSDENAAWLAEAEAPPPGWSPDDDGLDDGLDDDDLDDDVLDDDDIAGNGDEDVEAEADDDEPQALGPPGDSFEDIPFELRCKVEQLCRHGEIDTIVSPERHHRLLREAIGLMGEELAPEQWYEETRQFVGIAWPDDAHFGAPGYVDWRRLAGRDGRTRRLLCIAAWLRCTVAECRSEIAALAQLQPEGAAAAIDLLRERLALLEAEPALPPDLEKLFETEVRNSRRLATTRSARNAKGPPAEPPPPVTAAAPVQPGPVVRMLPDPHLVPLRIRGGP